MRSSQNRLVRWLRGIAVAAFAGIAATAQTRADSPAPPRDYVVRSDNGAYVFVMKAPNRPNYHPKPNRAELSESEREQREDKIEEPGAQAYPRTGMYRADDVDNPLWIVDWYAHRVEIANDGVHIVRHGPWASSLKHRAVAFYANGKLLADYQIGELIENTDALIRTVSHFFWHGDDSFNNEALIYTLGLIDGGRFEFDLRTGSILKSTPPPPPVSYRAAVTLENGAQISLSGFHACRGTFVLLAKMRGMARVPFLAGFREDEEHENRGSIVHVPLEEVSRVNATHGVDEGKASWQVTSIHGAHLGITVDYEDTYCGEGPSGQLDEYRVADIRTIKMLHH